MTRARVLVVVLAMASLGFACSTSDGEKTPSPTGANGSGSASAGGASGASGACTDADALCDGNTVTRCDGGKLVKSACDDAYCKSIGRGPAIGCALDAKDQPTCRCGCVRADGKCQGSAATLCYDDGALRPFACTDQACKDAGYTKGLQAGKTCLDDPQGAYCACVPNCTSADNKCSADSSTATLSYCDGTGVKSYACAAVCKEDGLDAVGCGKGDKGTDVCFCGKKCASEAESYCTGNTLHYCDGKQLSDYVCSNQACKDAGYTSLAGCMKNDKGIFKCICNLGRSGPWGVSLSGLRSPRSRRAPPAGERAAGPLPRTTRRAAEEPPVSEAPRARPAPADRHVRR